MPLNNGQRKTVLRLLLIAALVAVAAIALFSLSAESRARALTWRAAASTLLIVLLIFAVNRLRGALYKNLPTSSMRDALTDALKAAACWIGAAASAVTATLFFPDLFGGLAILAPTIALIALGAFFLARALGMYVRRR